MTRPQEAKQVEGGLPKTFIIMPDWEGTRLTGVDESGIPMFSPEEARARIRLESNSPAEHTLSQSFSTQ